MYPIRIYLTFTMGPAGKKESSLLVRECLSLRKVGWRHLPEHKKQAYVKVLQVSPFQVVHAVHGGEAEDQAHC